MRKLVVLIAAFAALIFSLGEVTAYKMTEQQVRNTCGGSLRDGCVGSACAMGCEKKCGTQICTYNCCTKGNCGEQGCNGHIVGSKSVGGGSKVKLPRPAAIRQQGRAAQ